MGRFSVRIACFDKAATVYLTRLRIAQIILNMCRKLIVALLILGWISLSGFDVVEDLDEVPGQVSVSSASPINSAKVGGRGPLANNMVESANRIPLADSVPVTFCEAVFELDPAPDFRRHFQLHKLYRVFLI